MELRVLIHFVFIDCKLTADKEATKVYLGRPWRPYAKTVFINTQMDAHILPVGWDPWKGDNMFPDKEKTTFYAEYGSNGPGGKTNARVAWSKQLDKSAISEYNAKQILGDWLPATL